MTSEKNEMSFDDANAFLERVGYQPSSKSDQMFHACFRWLTTRRSEWVQH